ncbi:MAG TPA: glycosyltransferase [Saprospiraceae bacterium]|nr:glycosyltransferase [Saprospiraceae bacterium]
MSNEKPVIDVSVIIPNYNYGRYLGACLDSIIASTVLPLEVIVVDDGSEDDSLAILEDYKEWSFLKVIAFRENSGLTAVLNIALDHAHGKYIMRMDADDIMHPERIVKQYAFLEEHQEVDVLGCNVIYFRVDVGQGINRSNFPTDHAGIEKRYRIGEHGIQHPTVCIRSEVYKKYRYQKDFPGEDYEIMSRMVLDGYIFANLPEALHFMRVHPGSSTSSLKYSGILKTFRFRDRLFHTRTGKLRMFLYFHHIRFYRKFQLTDHRVLRWIYLFISSILYPKKLINRLLRWLPGGIVAGIFLQIYADDAQMFVLSLIV